MSNFKALNYTATSTKIEKIEDKTSYERDLEAKGYCTIQGMGGVFSVCRDTYRGVIKYTSFEEVTGLRVGGSMNEEQLINELIHLAGLGVKGSAAANLAKVGNAARIVGNIGIKIGSFGLSTGLLAISTAAKGLGNLANLTMKQAARLNPDLAGTKAAIEKAAKVEAVRCADSKYVVEKFNQFEDRLINGREDSVEVVGPFGLVLVERSVDSQGRELFVIISDKEITRRREAKESVQLAMHVAGFPDNAVVEAGRVVASVGLNLVGLGATLLGKGLTAISNLGKPVQK